MSAHFTRNLIWFSAALSFAVLVTRQSATATTTFTDLASYEAALGRPATLVDDFSDGYTSIAPPLDRSSYTITEKAGSAYVSSGEYLVIGNMGGLTFAFDDPVTSLAFDHRFLSAESTLQVSSGTFSEDIPLTLASQFFGVIFDRPVSTMEFRNLSPSTSGRIRIDNLRAHIVPEPASLVTLCIGGLTLMQWWRCRRR